jgi:hypothetical protein
MWQAQASSLQYARTFAAGEYCFKEDSMKQSLIFVLIAVLSAGLVFVACSDGSDSGGGPSSYGGWLLDREVIDGQPTTLLDALDNPLYKVIGVTTTKLTLTADMVIPADKTVVLFAELDTSTFMLEVQGDLVVEGSGILMAKNTGRVRITDGSVEVINGTIAVTSIVSVYLRDIQNQAFGTSQVRFSRGTLDLSALTAKLASLDDIKTAFSWVPKGEVIIGDVTAAIKPSDLAKIETTAVRRLTLGTVGFVTPGDLAEELTIPAGLTFTTADPLPSLKSLTVLGDLTATDATLANVEDLTVAGEGALDAASATYAKLTNLTVSSEFEAPALSGLATLTVEAGGDFSAPSVTGGDEGITLAVEQGGVAEITSINKLNPSVIAGTLTATSFTKFDTTTPNAPTPLTAADGAVINDIPFTAETKVAALSATGVTTEDFTVSASKALTIPANAVLTIAAGSLFTYDGQVTIEADGVLALATTSQASVAKIAGTGAITTGQTIIGGAWEAVGTGDGTLTITGNANGAVIAKTDAATGLKGSAATAAITQKGGEESNTITLSATLDLSAFGSLTLQGAASHHGLITLTQTDGVIQGGGTTGEVTTTNITEISGIGKNDLTIGADLVFKCNATGSAFFTITGGSSANTLGDKTGALTLDKATSLTFTS